MAAGPADKQLDLFKSIVFDELVKKVIALIISKIPFVSWGFQALLLALCAWGVSELSSLSKSVQDLNVKMAVVLERDSTRGDQIKVLGDRIERLEGRREPR